MKTNSDTHATSNNPLLREISVLTKSRIIDAIFPHPTSYDDEILDTLTGVDKILNGLSELSELKQNEDDLGGPVGGSLSLSLSSLMSKEIKRCIILLQGAAFEGNNIKNEDTI